MFIVQPKEPGAWLGRILVQMVIIASVIFIQINILTTDITIIAININTRMRTKLTVATLQTICPGTPAISQAPVQPAQDPI